MKNISTITVFVLLLNLSSIFILEARAEGTNQQVTISGTVTDASNDKPLPGVNIGVKNATNGTSTNRNGEYELTVESEADTLVFSFVGYQTKAVAINGRSQINVQLVPQVFRGEEMVVVGYGTQEKSTLTGSVASIQGKTLEKSPSVSLSNTLSGKMPGLVALNRSGEPGEDFSSLLIRGKSTLGNNDPLIVIDGIPSQEGLNAINPHDVESVSVLKGASGAIYGARAANGVILVTTKKGILGKPTISYNFNQGIVQPTVLPDYADAATFANFLNYQADITDSPPIYTSEEIQKFRSGSDHLAYPNTDWIEGTFKRYTTQSKHFLSIRGGADNIKYYVSGNYSNQNGIFQHGINNYHVYGGRANIQADITDDLNVSAEVSLSEQNHKRPHTSTDYIIQTAYRTFPTLVDRYPNGLPGLGLRDGGTANPQVMATDATGYRNKKTDLTQTKISFDYAIPFMEGFSISGRFAYNKRYINSTDWATPWTVYQYDSSTEKYNPLKGGPHAPELTHRNETYSYTNENLKLSYGTKTDKHSFNGFIAFEQSLRKSQYVQAYRENFPSDVIDLISAGGSSNQQTDGSATRFARRNILGRLRYSYQDKYLFNFNVRYDGSTNFPKAKRYGIFPGISAGWVITDEPFFQGVGFMDRLKLRASWGQVGNDKIAPYQYLATYSLVNGTIFGLDKTLRQGLNRGVEPNPNVTWEVSTTTDLGLDAELWNGLLDLTIDIFKTRRTDILVPRLASVPDYTGLSLPDQNLGIVENKGFELQLTHRQVVNDKFNYSISGNVSFARNKVINMDEAEDIPEWQKEEGLPIGSNLYYQAIGIYRSQEEIDNSPHQPDAIVNDLKFKDVNNDGNINSDDMVRLPKTNIPEVVFGTDFLFEYGDFDMDIFLQGQTRSWRYFWLPQGTFGNVLQDFAENRPGPNNPNSKYPNIYSSETQYRQNNFWIYNTTFLRLKNMELGYSLSPDLIKKIGLEKARIYLNGRNLLTLTKFKFGDPEGTGGNRALFYPQNRIFNLGINVKF